MSILFLFQTFLFQTFAPWIIEMGWPIIILKNKHRITSFRGKNCMTHDIDNFLHVTVSNIIANSLYFWFGLHSSVLLLTETPQIASFSLMCTEDKKYTIFLSFILALFFIKNIDTGKIKKRQQYVYWNHNVDTRQ